MMNKNTDMKRFDKSTVKRLIAYLLRYKLRLAAVLALIVISAVAGVVPALFLQSLIDNYVTPMLLASSSDFSGLLIQIGKICVVLAAGMTSTYLYNRIMVEVAQGTLKKIRDDMFTHMQSLPIRYFDTHTHGDVMSYYTNDTDTLRQMITQSIPQVIASVVTIVAVFVSMLSVSIWLTLFVVVCILVMMRVIRQITGKSGTFFVRQQQSLAEVNGYIEEMIHGQKVIKVFCHEEKAKEGFDERNERLCADATEANKFANILMPVVNNMGYILYVLLALVGGAMAVAGVWNISITGTGALTLGMIASFLQLSRSFIMPISQVSQQLSSIVMALAGAERIFSLIDEQSEADDGYVTLVNATKKSGELRETEESTGLWAWKHPHEDGTVTYTELCGEVEFNDVDFGYAEDKIVLHNITLHAKLSLIHI